MVPPLRKHNDTPEYGDMAPMAGYLARTSST